MNTLLLYLQVLILLFLLLQLVRIELLLKKDRSVIINVNQVETKDPQRWVVEMDEIAKRRGGKKP